MTNVLYTQYFDDTAEALHENYWLPATEFGVPHSHGCVGMPLAEAQWFWNWASYDVPVSAFQTGEIDQVAVIVQNGVASAPKVMLGAARVSIR